MIYIIGFILFLLLLTVYGLIYLLSTEMPNLRTLYRTFSRDVNAVYRYFKVLCFIKRCQVQDQTVLDYFRSVSKKYEHRTCFIFQEDKWTYREVDELSNKIANLFLSLGYSKGDEVALLLDNCPEYVCIWLGLAKIGCISALVNTNLKRESLAHSLNVINVKAVIFGRNHSDAVKDAVTFFKNKEAMQYYCFTPRGSSTDQIVSVPAKSLNSLLEDTSVNPINPEKVKVGFSDKMLYIYTSGTTGLPKAAVIRHNRFIWICAAAEYLSQLQEFEIIYNPLPMYHSTGGILFVSVVLMFGGTMIIRKKFSASNFWKEAAIHKATIAQYIGEICRFLLNQPVREEEKKHCVRLMFGNGLKPHIWKDFQDRFRIKHINEFYASTEGNANMVNMFGKAGAVGFIPRICNRVYPVHLVKVDPETDQVMRNSKGLCIRCKAGEPGEIAGKIVSNPINSFDGYSNKADTRKRIIRDCFDKGDMAFRSGDILVMDEDGYLYFVDRTGDTFRWRGENVSTVEVENVLSTVLGHVSCVVYGVEIPNVEGRAGMVAVQTHPENISSDLYQNLSKRLPPYAIPLFIRVSSEIEVTGTYKLKKVALQKDGYDPEKISDPLFFLDARQKTYVPLTQKLYSDIVTGKMDL